MMFNNFINGLENETNVSITENGATGYKTTKHEIVDFNFKVASYRSKSENEIKSDFKKVWGENKELALKYLFYIRDIREGLGERRLFRTIILDIIDELDSRVFNWIAEYGRYDDILIFRNTKLENDMITFIADTLTKDVTEFNLDKPITLLAKWLPSINTSSKKTKEYANWLSKKLKMSSREYRKVLSMLRKHLDVVERKLCAQQYDQIIYESVPSQANLKYKDAFLKHDKERREFYLNGLVKGETKINASTLFPHDIVNKYMGGEGWRQELKSMDVTLEELWKSLPNYVNGNTNTLVVRDGSGSMGCTVGNSSVTALEVATALSIYFSERCDGAFKDKFITFSSQPKFVDLHNLHNLHDKLRACYREDDCSNTDIEKTFDLVLNVAIKNNLKQEEIPNLLIISDMEFDAAHRDYYHSQDDKKLFKTIAAKFNEAGYELPRLIFWNVNSRTNTIPLTQNENGVILVSGFSPVITKMVLSEENDPYKALVKEITSDRYKQITLNKGE